MLRATAIGLGILLGSATPVLATALHMQRLPTSSAFRCLNCHVAQDPVAPTAQLNVFGAAFRDNSFRWDRTLAALRSDSDNCTNGFELGDENGDGRPDAGVTTERSNPGQSDCTLEISPQAWSNLKKLFR
jgi:hypothetical protein